MNKRGVMELRLIISREDVEAPGLQRREIGPGVLLYFDPDSADLTFQLANDRQVYLWGDVFYLLDGDGTPLTRDLKANLQRSFETQTLEKALQNIEGTFIGILVDPRTSRVELFSDSFARIDCFYAETGRGLVVSTTLDPIFERVAPQYDQLMLAHFFSMYGWNPPKSHTIYSNVQRLSVGEIISFSSSGLSKRSIEWRPESYGDYGPQDLEKYYQALRTSVISRADQSGVNWVWFSGGWDTSAILAILIDEFGTDKVQQIIGRMNFSSKTGPAIMNVFELEKAERICAFYGIKPNFVDFDLTNPDTAKYVERGLPYFRARHVYNNGGNNFMRLSDGIVNIAGKGHTVFNGDASDSFHNFGFCQYHNVVHPKKGFQEYIDKMSTYLWGPTFFSRVLDDTYQSDTAYQIIRKLYEGPSFDSTFSSREEKIQSFLLPFFYGGPRIPFTRTVENPILRPGTLGQLRNYPFGQYMPQVIGSLTPENIYSWLCHLYHHFHCQGSTMGVVKTALNYNEHRWRSPFHDLGVVGMLSRAPESWGRGLELNNTKYPLKWVCRNKLKFPYEVMEEGHHCYLYEVSEEISPAAEALYRSGLTPLLKDSVKSRSYRDILSPEAFDLDYMDRLVDDYLNGAERVGADFLNTFSLVNLCATGWY